MTPVEKIDLALTAALLTFTVVSFLVAWLMTPWILRGKR